MNRILLAAVVVISLLVGGCIAVVFGDDWRCDTENGRCKYNGGYNHVVEVSPSDTTIMASSPFVCGYSSFVCVDLLGKYGEGYTRMETVLPICNQATHEWECPEKK